MGKTLWIHHYQACWAIEGPHAFDLDCGFTRRLNAFIRRWMPETIILTLFDRWELEDFHFNCRALVSHPRLQVHEMGYGWEAGMEIENFIPGDRHSEIIPLERWMDALKVGRIALAGGFEGECLNDAETILDHFKANYFKPSGLTV